MSKIHGMQFLSEEGRQEVRSRARALIHAARKANGFRLDGRRLSPPGERPDRRGPIGLDGLAWLLADSILAEGGSEISLDGRG